MGLVHGAYDAKAEGFSPGGASLHNCMTGHGPDAETFEKASRADLSKPDVIKDTMAFMFETRFVWRPTASRARIGRSCSTTTTAAGRACRSTSTRASHERTLDATHDPALTSWVESANDPATDFPIQNLPFGRFRRAGRRATGGSAWRSATRCSTCARAGLIDTDDMNRLMRLLPRGARARCARRSREGLREGSAQEARLREALVPQADVDDGPALPHRRLHRLLHQHPPRHHGRQAVPPRQPAAAELQVGADRLPRPGLVDRRERPSSFRRPQRPDQGARRATRPSCRPDAAARLRARARRLHRPAECAGRAGRRSSEAEDHLFGVDPVQRLVGARHPGLGVPAARARSCRRTSRARCRPGS